VTIDDAENSACNPTLSVASSSVASISSLFATGLSATFRHPLSSSA
jgi:hypothetical protein